MAIEWYHLVIGFVSALLALRFAVKFAGLVTTAIFVPIIFHMLPDSPIFDLTRRDVIAAFGVVALWLVVYLKLISFRRRRDDDAPGVESIMTRERRAQADQYHQREFRKRF